MFPWAYKTYLNTRAHKRDGEILHPIYHVGVSRGEYHDCIEERAEVRSCYSLSKFIKFGKHPFTKMDEIIQTCAAQPPAQGLHLSCFGGQ